MDSLSKDIVLMYHGVVEGELENSFAAEDLYDVRLKDFREQMDFLKRENYSVGLLDEGTKDKTKVVLTIDDGEISNYAKAWPILKDHQFKAYFFILVDRIGKPGYMGWKELNELFQAGMKIGSHGMNHEILTQLGSQELKRVLLDSRLTLEKNLKREVRDFSVPRGQYNAEVLKAAQDCGYEHFFVSDESPASAFCIGRTAVKKSWNLKRFEMALHGQKPFPEKILSMVKRRINPLLRRLS